MRRTLRIDVSEVVDAMTMGVDGMTMVLDLSDGSVHELFDPEAGHGDALGIDVVSEDTVDIPRRTSDEGYQVMASFIDTVEALDVAELLQVAIQGRGAFGRFKDVVRRDPALEERWYAYQHDAEYKAALRWLESLDIEVVDTSPRGPAPPAPAKRPPAVGLVDALLLGASGDDGTSMRRVVPARDAADARRIFRGLARDICAVLDFPWRKSLVEGRAACDLGRFHLRIADGAVELTVDVSDEVRRMFSAK